MNLHNHYYYFKNALSHKFCDDVIAYGKKQQEQLALTGNVGRERDLKTNPLAFGL